MRCFFVVLLVDFIEDTSDAAYGGAGSCVDVRGTAALVLEALGEVDIVIDGSSRVESGVEGRVKMFDKGMRILTRVQEKLDCTWQY
jgi:hypothetical protein